MMSLQGCDRGVGSEGMDLRPGNAIAISRTCDWLGGQGKSKLGEYKDYGRKNSL